MQTKLTVALATALTLGGSAAIAQNWQGFYGGGSLSFGMFDSEVLDVDEDAAYGFSSNDGFGGLANLSVGYNWQMDNLVLGVEGQIGLGFMDETITYDFCSPTIHSTDINSVASLRGKAGVASGNSLFYATGGIAVIDRDDQLLCEDAADSSSFLADGTLTSFVAGVGFEHMMSDNMSIKGEWLVYQSDDELVLNGSDSESFFDLKMQTISIGVNYYFGR